MLSYDIPERRGTIAAIGKDVMTSEFEAKLQLVLDRQEIADVLATYCRAIDRCDLELLKTVYHPDATDNHGSFNGNAHEFAEFIIPTLREVILDGMHTITHSLIEVEGDFAVSEAYYWAYQRCHGGEAAVTPYFGPAYAERVKAEGLIDGYHDYYCGGRYIDLFERRADRWKILRRIITNEWNDIRPSRRITNEGAVADFNLPGQRDRNDPIYLLKLRVNEGKAL
jgi:ketosteroid isomerase-like protein